MHFNNSHTDQGTENSCSFSDSEDQSPFGMISPRQNFSFTSLLEDLFLLMAISLFPQDPNIFYDQVKFKHKPTPKKLRKRLKLLMVTPVQCYRFAIFRKQISLKALEYFSIQFNRQTQKPQLCWINHQKFTNPKNFFPYVDAVPEFPTFLKLIISNCDVPKFNWWVPEDSPWNFAPGKFELYHEKPYILKATTEKIQEISWLNWESHFWSPRKIQKKDTFDSDITPFVCLDRPLPFEFKSIDLNDPKKKQAFEILLGLVSFKQSAKEQWQNSELWEDLEKANREGDQSQQIKKSIALFSEYWASIAKNMLYLHEITPPELSTPRLLRSKEELKSYIEELEKIQKRKSENSEKITKNK